jgi:isopentenyl-diphosphate delta-isomerase
VYAGRENGPIRINPDEICAWRWISPETLRAELAEGGPERFTPWFRLEWERIWRDHRAELRALR